MSMYWSMLRGIALVCIVDPTNTVDLTCLLECNVFGGITAVVLSRCRSIYLTLCGSNITSSSLLHRKYLLLLCCLLKVSQYRLALIDTASVHIVKDISQHIRNSDDNIFKTTDPTNGSRPCYPPTTTTGGKLCWETSDINVKQTLYRTPDDTTGRTLIQQMAPNKNQKYRSRQCFLFLFGKECVQP